MKCLGKRAWSKIFLSKKYPQENTLAIFIEKRLGKLI